MNHALVLVIDHEQAVFVKLNQEMIHGNETDIMQRSLRDTAPHQISTQYLGTTTLGDNKYNETYLQTVPLNGLASIAIQQKKTLLVTEPLSYEEYDPTIDLRFGPGNTDV